MARLKKKGESGSAVLYMTRERALRKLRLTLPQFRKLCILKGIYPRNPKRKLRNSKRTYYYVKDIRYMSHDPMIQNFRDHQIWLRRLRSAKMRRLPEKVKSLLENEPKCSLDYLVKERYPTFMDALRDLDDALIMIHLFSTIPSDVVSPDRVENCTRLCREFQHYVIHTRSLRKVFISIKGIYFQARIMETDVTWMVPHTFTYTKDDDVDYDVMLTFLSFYEVLMGFVNYRLYHTIGQGYPPALGAEKDQFERRLEAPAAKRSSRKGDSSASGKGDDGSLEKIQEALAGIEASEEEEEEERALEEGYLDQNHEFKNLFSRFTFFLNREVSHGYMEFIIRCFGGSVFYQSTRPDLEDAECITHQVVDRGKDVPNRRLDREYVQPQWVFDCINARKLLPTTSYGPTACLPPHLSPFVVGEKSGEKVGEAADDSAACRESDQLEESSSEQELVYEKELLEETRPSENAQPSLIEQLKLRALEKKRAAQKERQSLEQLRHSMLPSKPRRLLKFIENREKLRNRYRKHIEDKAKLLSSKKLVNRDGVLVENQILE
ncbi:pescadillo homolog [Schistocerca gregaria]|uniref:pescadillo homolog n=1 Tax=Schistocerca gregaria TaxID=7010 RepID=UPI00211E5F57|nr:pescadillo homolog [Schistocerca gregaria]